MANLDPQNCPNDSEGANSLFLWCFPLLVMGAESALLQDTEGEQKKAIKNSILALSTVTNNGNLVTNNGNSNLWREVWIAK
ncbi:TPA: hypothetical protein ACX3KE_005172 [Enterobacter kobei]|jgi:hypothetical protein